MGVTLNAKNAGAFAFVVLKPLERQAVEVVSAANRVGRFCVCRRNRMGLLMGPGIFRPLFETLKERKAPELQRVFGVGRLGLEPTTTRL